MGFPGGSVGNARDASRHEFDPCVRKIPWRKAQPAPVFLPGESRRQKSLVGYSLWNRRVGHGWNDWASRKHAWCLVVVDKREKCKQRRPPCHFHCFYSCHLMSRSTWNVYFIVSNIYLCLHRYVDNAISCCCSCPEVFGFCLSRYPITASPSCLFFPHSFFSLFLSFFF